MYGQIVINLPVACGVVSATCIKNVRRNIQHVHTGMLQLQASGRRETPSVQQSRLQPREGRDPQKKVSKNPKDHNGKGVLF
jgi:hypothetical protein